MLLMMVTHLITDDVKRRLPRTSSAPGVQVMIRLLGEW